MYNPSLPISPVTDEFDGLKIFFTGGLHGPAFSLVTTNIIQAQLQSTSVMVLVLCY